MIGSAEAQMRRRLTRIQIDALRALVRGDRLAMKKYHHAGRVLVRISASALKQ